MENVQRATFVEKENRILSHANMDHIIHSKVKVNAYYAHLDIFVPVLLWQLLLEYVMKDIYANKGKYTHILILWNVYLKMDIVLQELLLIILVLMDLFWINLLEDAYLALKERHALII